MTKIAVRASIVAGAFIVALYTQPAQAQDRVFVSGSGVDTNPCTFTAPCRTFQQAYNTAPANGEIYVIDPAGYGPLTITKPISVQAHGFGGITGISGTNAITINIPNANAESNVNLNGLLLDGAGVGADGILVTAASAVTIVNCEVRNFVQNGIEDVGDGVYRLAVVNTIASDNGYNFGNYSGIYIHASGSGYVATITGLTATANGANGIAVNGGVNVTIFSSNASNNATNGILAQSSATVMVRDTVASNNNGDGFVAESSSQLTLAHSVASGNNKGIYVNGGTVNTYQDNHVLGNYSNVVGTLNNATPY
jgi:parallel beta-helix repeat protein